MRRTYAALERGLNCRLLLCLLLLLFRGASILAIQLHVDEKKKRQFSIILWLATQMHTKMLRNNVYSGSHCFIQIVSDAALFTVCC